MEIYHYTKLDVLYSMFKNAKSGKGKEGEINEILSFPSKDFITFWASCAYYMNDPKELRSSFDMILSKLPEIEDDLKIEDNKKISKWIQEQDTSFDDWLNNVIFSPESFAPFIISFSTQPDYLPMWSMYGQNGVGVSLCFDTDDFECSNFPVKDIENVNYKMNETCLQKIITVYNKYIDKLKSPISSKREQDINNIMLFLSQFGDKVPDEIKEKLHAIIKEYASDDFVSEELVKESIAQLTRTSLAEMILELATIVKDHSYEYEKEYRCVISLPTHPAIAMKTPEIFEYRMSNGNIIPYIKVDVPIKCLKKIIIGPCSNYNMVRMSLKLMMKTYGIPDIDIAKSDVPYRNM
jgi:Protein of unknown function (DUF2971).